jgi:Dna[CI] antecedent, DciA
MQSLSHALRKAVSKHHNISEAALVGLVMHIVGKYLETTIDKGYIRHNILFLTLTDHAKKIQIFQQKKVLMDHIHVELTKQ